MIAKAFRVMLGGMMLLAIGCSRPDPRRVQGYIEGEFVYVASPLAGQLETLSVQRGDWVKAGDLLFELEHAAEQAARDEADHRLAQAKATLEDLKKGRRPTELASLEAQLQQARDSFVNTQREFERQEKLRQTGAGTADEFDRALSLRDRDRHRIIQLEADLQTARLGSRTDQISAAEADVRARTAMLAKADWDLNQKRQLAPQYGLVFDTLYRQGEWVAAGRPVIVLLPPPNVKARAFVPETLVGSIQPGDQVRVTVDGVSEPIIGKVSYISPKAEYTPPVIYSQESRSKLVFMVEAVFDPADAAKLHPGQPIDVRFGE